jgi:hypothetical protein
MLKIISRVMSGLLLFVYCIACSERLANPVIAIMSESSLNIDDRTIVLLAPEVIASITGKDLVHPTLSPDGKFLAYAEVLVQKGVENTAVRILNLETRKSTLLIDDKTAAKYKTYSSFVSAMNWSQTDRLVVTISDGDVDSTELTFDPGSYKLISTKFQEAGISPEVKARQEKLLQQIRSLFPTVNFEVLKNEIYRRQILANGTILIPGKLFDQEDNLWIFNLHNKSVKKLLNNQDPLAKSLLRDDSRLKIIYSSSQRTIIIVYIYASYEQGNNPLYILENGRLRRSTDYQELYDVSVDTKGKRIAYCYWINGKRQIVVKELK